MTEILMYGIVGDSWDGLDANTLVPMISEGDDDLIIRINSPGGYVMEGLALYNALARARSGGRTVEVYIDGLCASMASVIAMAGEKIAIADNALMMIHNPWDCACGDAAELRRAADVLDRIRDQLVGIYSKQSGLGAEELIAMLDAETWFTAEEALTQGFVTEIVPALQVAACNVKAFGFRKVPDSPLITMRAMGPARAAPAAPRSKESTMKKNSAVAALVAPEITTVTDPDSKVTTVTIQPVDDGESEPEGSQPNQTEAVATPPLTAAASQKAVAAGIAAERERISSIRSAVAKARLPADFGDALVDAGTPIEDARAKILDKLAEGSEALQIGHNGPMRVTQDVRDKFRQGAVNWLLVKAGVAPLVIRAAAARGEKISIDPGEFRGVRNSDLAREALQIAGIQMSHRDPDMIVREAMTAKSAITQTISDFPVLFEEAMHKTLQAAYAVTPDTWTKFAGTGSVNDFRLHHRYLRGSFGALDAVNEAGEFKNKPIPDLAKELIKATTKGNIINLSRQAIVNDDMEAFSGLAVDLGRAAKLTIEIDVYALLNSNPTMNDGVALFHATHGNLSAAGAAPSVTAFDAIRVAMASQKDLSGNEFLEIRPAIGLFPLGLGGAARILNGSQYDPDAVNKLQRPNIVNGMLEEVVDTPRLTGTAYYFFADPNVSPAIEVVFLNGVTEPFTDSEEGWRVDGVEWKVRHDYGVGAVNYRSAYKQLGA